MSSNKGPDIGGKDTDDFLRLGRPIPTLNRFWRLITGLEADPTYIEDLHWLSSVEGMRTRLCRAGDCCGRNHYHLQASPPFTCMTHTSLWLPYSRCFYVNLAQRVSFRRRCITRQARDRFVEVASTRIQLQGLPNRERYV